MTTHHDNDRPYDALIFDLDGVVTHTADLHFRAWKSVFDEFLQNNHPDQEPFSRRDFDRTVNGMPRYDGVRSFLRSRDIHADEGGEDDTLEHATVRGIGNEKNKRFNQLLEQEGPGLFDDALQCIRAARELGIAVAVASSSRNCQTIIEAAGIADLFDARVDGTTLAELDLPGKPEPDMFTEAARRLDTDPQRAVVFEDATSGVEAGAKGGFALVVGVDRSGRAGEALRNHGANWVLRTLDTFDPAAPPRHPDRVPHCNDNPDALRHQLDGREPAFFLDYDGTLTPIVPKPEDAVMHDDMRDTVRALAQHRTVAVVSGRDRKDVEQLVGLDNLVFAGSHGFDIRGPRGLEIEHGIGDDAIPHLDAAEKTLKDLLRDVPGAQIERKHFSMAVHYRNVPDDRVDDVRDAVERAAAEAENDALRVSGGKKVLEIQPNVEWDKGRAVLWLCDALKLDLDRVAPVYIGDDLTDEDAFHALRHRGVAIVVDPDGRATTAHFKLRDVQDTRRFLDSMNPDRNRP